MRKFVEFLKQEDGASAGEYALILAIIGTAVAAASISLGGSLHDGMTTLGTCISSAGATCPTYTPPAG